MRALFLFTAVISAWLAASCNKPARTVVLYSSVDRSYAEPVLREFTRSTGIRVLPVYDEERSGTNGLVERLISEKDRPNADVFWNGEFVQTLMLKRRGLLAPYASGRARGLSGEWADRAGYWTCFGGRVRVLLVNSQSAGGLHPPSELTRIADSQISPSQIAIADPRFGASLTQAATLFATLGAGPARSFYQHIGERGIRVVPGDSMVAAMVQSSAVMLGLTNSSDACRIIRSGAPVRAIIPDQGGAGALLIPNSVALIAGAPHPDTGKELIDYLLSGDVEMRLAQAGWIQFGARGPLGDNCLNAGAIKTVKPPVMDTLTQLEQAQREMTGIFGRPANPPGPPGEAVPGAASKQ